MLFTLRSGAAEHPEDSVLQHVTDQVTKGGVLDKIANDFKVAAQGTPDMTVAVNSGRAYLKNIDSPAHPVRSTATENVTITPNASGNTRIDAIVLYVDRATSANLDASNVAKLVAVAGTPAASPVAPTDGEIETAIGASNPYIRLANVTVVTGATSIVNGNISDQRYTFSFSFQSQDFKELSSSPSTPDTGFDKIYFKTDGKFYKKDDAGSESEIGNSLLTTDHYAPQGFLINGQIVRTVASNNLTVAIKTLAGANPSVTDPVYVRIGNTVRAITAALSVTKNAGTNWFNSGSGPFATFEIDYFVYLGWNATDGVVLGFARRPDFRTYGEFSVTSTDDRYGAISTITNAVSTDEYEVIGRFNAILGVTASFNWSLPATAVIVNRPIFETRWLTWKSTNPGLGGGLVVGAGTPPSGAITETSVYKVIGNRCTFRLNAKYAVAGAGNSGFDFDAPLTGFGILNEYTTLVHANISTSPGANPYLTPTSGAFWGVVPHCYTSLHVGTIAAQAVLAAGEYQLAT